MVMTAITGDIAAKVGPYTSSVTDALDLGLVVPVEVLAAIQLIRGRAPRAVSDSGDAVRHVCIGIVLMAQGVAQLATRECP